MDLLLQLVPYIVGGALVFAGAMLGAYIVGQGR